MNGVKKRERDVKKGGLFFRNVLGSFRNMLHY